ncbi:tRNA (cytidine(34)-2'-O)-methyltransferase [Yimella sp. cx-51]|uniref:tRNA (cytidine(34)-2'-O)-methyltransferase n=1 Tax=Yimella sp. cx-51 TaxID=2770551 RepID=UPI00165DBA2E|nr:tRNA (cytidine(34)-2'-O)-methyltransferase [Yimella sp. cx-51]MBC9957908.1 tRNA (cytidine(34)-2'-O)-methyltransferase [Yimella sp. cx-51]QTH38043.1 tRNA (cytidine(34)-2'-O)-methyltransferase [Yimella sp. cx-51]
MQHVVLFEPQIPPNTGNSIRLAACTPVHLHLVEPLGFTLADAQLRRAGLDYHDLAKVSVHPSLDDCFDGLPGQRVFAFTGHGETVFSQVAYEDGDVLLFGREADGLPAEVLDHPRITDRLRLPMLPGRRSLNLSNTVAIAVYEAWRQRDYRVPSATDATVS